MKLKILVTGGGTMGHVSPVLAVVKELKHLINNKHIAEFLFVGRRKSPEENFARRAGLDYAFVSSGKLRRYIDFQNFLDPIRVMIGFFQALIILLKFRPDVVFAKGGYVSVPIVAASALFRIQIVIHETDAVIGLSNRIAAKVAKTICTAFPVDNYKHQKIQHKIVYTGNPIQPEFFKIDKKIKKSAPYNLLVVGGSQGSVIINHALKTLIVNPINQLAIFHITGPNNYDAFTQFASTWYHPIAYTNNMVDLMAQADLVVSRAGGTIFELASAKCPTILIPLSSSANRHQTKNAAYFAQKNAAIVIDEADLSAESLRSEVKKIIKSPQLRAELSKAINKLAVPNAALKVAREILKAIDLK